MADDKNIHDLFMKSVFKDIERAQSYFQHRLPADLIEQIDLSKIQEVPGSFLNEELKTSFADILFEVPLKRLKKSLYLPILLEFKSWKDKYVTIQLGQYIFSGLGKQVKEGKKPRPVIPVLFYHGKDPWEYHTHRSLYNDLDDSLKKYIPEFDYIFDNIQATEESEILMIQAGIWRGIKLLLKRAWDEEDLMRSASKIFLEIDKNDRNLTGTAIVYYYYMITNKEKAMEALEPISDIVERGPRNAYEEILLEGYEKAQREKIEEQKATTKRNVVKSYNYGLKLQQISDVFDLSEEKVLRILKGEGLIK